MESVFLLVCSLLIGSIASNAAWLPAQEYWHTVLPNIRMLAALSDLLNFDTFFDSKTGTYVYVGKGRVDVHAGGDTTVGVGKGLNPFSYQYSATEEQLHDNLQVKIFFLEQDLHPGSKMNMQFDKINGAAKFLPKTVAESIPFSSKKLPEIINQFSVQPGSDEEEAMKETLRECEDPALKGEKKMCATSLESMVDFSIDTLGTTNIKVVSTTVHSKNETAIQEYTIIPSGVKNLAKDELVACHQQPYAYAVFYCHFAKSTKGYIAKMTGKDGVVVDAVAVCHTDTSAWNPKHVAFQVLNVKPGTVPVCHFLPQDHIVFTGNN